MSNTRRLIMSRPVKLELMDVDNFIRQHNILPVTSVFIRDSSSNEFHPDGLFSERIFGQIGSPSRLISYGYIPLNTRVFHPLIFAHIRRLKSAYMDVISGKSYAKYDNDTKELIPCDSDDPQGGTGYKFFIDNFPRIKFKKNDSLSRNDKIDLIEKYRNSCTMTNCIVMPAGLRDIQQDGGRVDSDSINKLYTALLNYSNAMPITGGDDSMFDSVRYAIQKKINEVYEMIFEMLEGKQGFFQKKFGARSLALGTRNVISPSDMLGEDPTDGKYMKCDELKIPLFQSSKMYQPLVVYQLKQLFFSQVFQQFTDQAPLIDPKTYDMRYQAITEDEKNKYTTSEGIEKVISLFRDKEFRCTPVTVDNEKGVKYYMFLVYDDGKNIFIGRSVTTIMESVQMAGVLYDKKHVRPLTYVEMLYIATYVATKDKHGLVTRYPAMEIGSTVPFKMHIASTNPGRTVTLYMSNNERELPEYPVITGQFVDSVVLHPTLMKGLGADFDGDVVSINSVLTEEANKEIAAHLETPIRYVSPSGKLYAGSTDIVSLVIYNLSRTYEGE